jgi:hypothetical protein
MPAGVVFGEIFDEPSFNDAGSAAFAALASNGPGGSFAGLGIWRAAPGAGPQLAVKRGDVVPGGGGTTFTDVTAPKVNNAGALAYVARTSANQFAVFTQPAGAQPQAVATGGQPAPGTTNAFASFSHAVINRDGRVAFQAVLNTGSSETNQSVFYWPGVGAQPQLLVREGAVVPGGATIVNNETGGFVPVMNANGFVAVATQLDLSGPGMGSAIFVFGPDGALARLIHTGDEIEVTPGVFKTIDGVRLNVGNSSGTGGEDGFHTPLNDLNELAFRATFDDQTDAVFVTVVPEPALLPALAATLLLPRARRRPRGRRAPAPASEQTRG